MADDTMLSSSFTLSRGESVGGRMLWVKMNRSERLRAGRPLIGRQSASSWCASAADDGIPATVFHPHQLAPATTTPPPTTNRTYYPRDSYFTCVFLFRLITCAGISRGPVLVSSCGFASCLLPAQDAAVRSALATATAGGRRPATIERES